jgi:hypothetical protein
VLFGDTHTVLFHASTGGGSNEATRTIVADLVLVGTCLSLYGRARLDFVVGSITKSRQKAKDAKVFRDRRHED